MTTAADREVTGITRELRALKRQIKRYEDEYLKASGARPSIDDIRRAGADIRT